MTQHTLVVAVRGWTTSGDWLLFGRPGSEIPDRFADALAERLPHAEFWRPPLDMAMFSMRSPESLSQELFAMITERLERSPHIQSVILLAYSSGSLLARRVFCMAHGAAIDGSISRPPASWADRIDRLVVLSGVTRGWEYSSAAPAHVRFLAPVLFSLSVVVAALKRWRAALAAGRHAEGGASPLIWQLMRGAPFVVSTRIQYLRVMLDLARRRGNAPPATKRAGASLRTGDLPSTIFLLGAKDEFISPADCTELGPRAEFLYIELPGSSHMDAIRVGDGSAGSAERLEHLVAAIAEPFDDLSGQDWTIPAGDIDDYLDPMDIAEDQRDPGSDRNMVQHAVMVVHGIRDHGFWTKRVAREIKRLGRESSLSVRAPTPTYGYFSMWDFMRPRGRERAVYWFMERYADVKAHFPAAKISFVGHSNGTYIAARAVELNPAIKFDSVVFAGSVVRRNFSWKKYQGQVGRVLNYVGRSDGVVAFLPAVCEFLRLSRPDVGGAGVFGFREADQDCGEKPVSLLRAVCEFLRLSRPDVGGAGVFGFREADQDCGEKPVSLIREVRYIRGGHGAAIAETFWEEIARFVLLDEVPERPSEARNAGLQWLFRVAPVITIAGIVGTSMILLLPVVVPVALIGTSSSGFSLAGALAIVSGSLFLSWAVRRFVKQW